MGPCPSSPLLCCTLSTHCPLPFQNSRCRKMFDETCFFSHLGSFSESFLRSERTMSELWLAVQRAVISSLLSSVLSRIRTDNRRCHPVSPALAVLYPRLASTPHTCSHPTSWMVSSGSESASRPPRLMRRRGASVVSASFYVGYLLLGRPGSAARTGSGAALENQSVTAGGCQLSW